MPLAIRMQRSPERSSYVREDADRPFFLQHIIVSGFTLGRMYLQASATACCSLRIANILFFTKWRKVNCWHFLQSWTLVKSYSIRLGIPVYGVPLAAGGDMDRWNAQLREEFVIAFCCYTLFMNEASRPKGLTCFTGFIIMLRKICKKGWFCDYQKCN